MLSEQVKNLKNLRYEKDYWKELELKGVIGGEVIDLELYKQDTDEQMALAIERFDQIIKDIRGYIDKESFAEINVLLQGLLETEGV